MAASLHQSRQTQAPTCPLPLRPLFLLPEEIFILFAVEALLHNMPSPFVDRVEKTFTIVGSEIVTNVLHHISSLEYSAVHFVLDDVLNHMVAELVGDYHCKSVLLEKFLNQGTATWKLEQSLCHSAPKVMASKTFSITANYLENLLYNANVSRHKLQQ